MLTVVTSAYSSYSSCRQYREDLAGRSAPWPTRGVDARAWTRSGPTGNHPGFARANSRLVTEAARAALRGGAGRAGSGWSSSRTRSRRRWTTRPAPATARATSTAASTCTLAGAVTDEVNATLSRDLDFELVYCSRSGPPSQPWLEPDVNDRLEELAAEGVTDVVVAPIGFVSDHMEVGLDLDTEAAATAERVGLRMVRVPTVGTDAEFVAGLVDLALERAGQARGEAVPTPAWPGDDVRPPSAPRVLPQPARRQAGPVWVRTDARDPGADELAELEQPGRRRATEAGRFIVDERPAELGVAETKSSATDVVTVMDQQAEDCCGGGSPPPGRATRSSARRPRHRRQLRHHLAGRPHRRHRQLPLRHPRLLRLGRGGDRGRVGARRLAPCRRGGLQPQHR